MFAEPHAAWRAPALLSTNDRPAVASIATAAQMLMKSLPILALVLGAHGLAQAAPDLPDVGNVHAPLTVALPEIPEGGWFTSAELGAISTSGNTTGTSVTGKIDARHETASWSHEFVVSGFFKEDEYETDDGTIERSKSAERFAASAKASLKLLGDGKRAFIIGSHVNDRFGAYTRY